MEPKVKWSVSALDVAHSLMSHLLAEQSRLGIDALRMISVAYHLAAGKKFAPGAGCGVASISLVEVEAVAAEHIAHFGARLLHRHAHRDDAAYAHARQLVGHGEADVVVHQLLVVAVEPKCVVVAVLGVGPGHVPYYLDLLVGADGEHVVLEPLQIGEGVGQTREVAGLLERDDVPLVVGDDVVERHVVASHGLAPDNLAVTILGLAGLCVAPVAVYRAATDIGVADDQTVALGGSQLVEVLLNGVLGEAVADGEHLNHAGCVGRDYGHQQKDGPHQTFHVILDFGC